MRSRQQVRPLFLVLFIPLLFFSVLLVASLQEVDPPPVPRVGTRKQVVEGVVVAAEGHYDTVQI